MTQILKVACLVALGIGACRTPETQVASTTDLNSQDMGSLQQFLLQLRSGRGIPTKFDMQNRPVRPNRARFEHVPSESYLRYRDLHRRFRVICETRDDPKFCSHTDNLTFYDPLRLLDKGSSLVANVFFMDQRDLFRGEVLVQPWSSGYWLVSDGLTAHRYSAAGPPTTKDVNAVNLNDGAQDDDDDAETLSPAEKYDLAMAAAGETLVQSQWALGQQTTERPDDPVSFHDIAHGWAAASIAMPRPVRSVSVPIKSDVAAVFYPEDIKALGALLWANTRYPIRYVGGPCMEWESAQNAQSSCQSFDAATFHLAIINTIGLHKSPLIMDATLDPDIFHRPVVAYEMSFFSIDDHKLSQGLNDARRALPIAKDPWASQRSPMATHAVGVAATLTYVTQRDALAEETDSRDSDELLRVTYLYDLDLSADGDVLGGFWYQDVHPDFLWRPEPETNVSTWGDSFVRGHWQSDLGELPWSWKKGGEYDARSGKPLGKFVSSLFEVAAEGYLRSKDEAVVGFSFHGQETCAAYSGQCPQDSSADSLQSNCYAMGATVFTCAGCKYLCSAPLAPRREPTSRSQ